MSETFFQNKECKYFPCHKVKDEAEFNCMFCYCPLYTLGDKCGGNFVILENDIKDCSNCTLCHGKNGAEYVFSKFEQISEIEKKNRKEG